MSRRRRTLPASSSPDWFRRHRRLIVGGAVVAATITRILYFAQLNASSLIDMQRWNQSDMNYYDAWARTIAAGDWLSRSVKPPMHHWQREVADEYINHHPELARF